LSHGERCDVGSCEAGSICAGSTDDETPLCLQFCNEDPDCDDQGPGSLCVLGFGAPVLWANACSIDCNPAVNPSRCANGLRCSLLWTLDTDEILTDCQGTIGAGTHGSPCVATEEDPHRDCAAGHVCAPISELEDRCFQLCRMTGGVTCPSGSICTSLEDPWIIGTVEYGFCTLTL
jgi:hypothetical protein